jgi:hypothetical protein
LLELAKKHSAMDTTQRQSALQEIAAIQPRRSQHVPGNEIPERSWAYKLAKWYAFHDYGMYTRNFDASNWVDPDQASHPSEDLSLRAQNLATPTVHSISPPLSPETSSRS